MKDFFKTLYDTWIGIYNADYDLIFDQLTEGGSYIDFALLFIFIPIVITGLFYFLYRNPYAKWWYWLIVILFSAIIVWIATREVAYLAIFETSNESLNEALNDPDSKFEEYALPLHYQYAHYNAALSLGISFLVSMIMRPFSKIQKHLPF